MHTFLNDIMKPHDAGQKGHIISESDLAWVYNSVRAEGIARTVKSVLAYTQRSSQLLEAVPTIKMSNTVLYVGARDDRMDFGEMFRKAGCTVDVLEVYKPNVDFLRNIHWIRSVIHGDVRSIDTLTSAESYDTVFWWHGPEHIPCEDFSKTLTKLKEVAKKHVVCACPFGIYQQEAINGNQWEQHRAALYPGDFEKQDFKTSTRGEPNLKLSNVLAWHSK